MKKQFKQEIWPVNQLFIFAATGLITLFLLKAASDILVPFLISIAIAIVLSPHFTYLETKHIPKVVSLVVIILLSLLPIIIFGGYVADEAKDFATNYQTIKASFMQGIQSVTVHLNQMGINVNEENINAVLEKSNLGEILRNLATQANNQFSNLFLIFFMVAFMLMESKYFYAKMLKIANDYDMDSDLFIEIHEKIKSYFSIKVKTSLVTAVWVLAVLWFYDIPYCFMWAVLAFFLNFIPVIGSILAAIPAVVLALLDHGLMTTVWIMTWYLIINMVIGNILEPKIMGKGLGLSALVIFLSMTFWGWIFGPTGMILSVPLTMIVQYLFDQYKETQWIALLLSDYKKEA
jgi:predicted PurR-regulated permease PerM